MWLEMLFDILNRLGVDHKGDGLRDGRTDRQTQNRH